MAYEETHATNLNQNSLQKLTSMLSFEKIYVDFRRQCSFSVLLWSNSCEGYRPTSYLSPCSYSQYFTEIFNPIKYSHFYSITILQRDELLRTLDEINSMNVSWFQLTPFAQKRYIFMNHNFIILVSFIPVTFMRIWKSSSICFWGKYSSKCRYRHRHYYSLFWYQIHINFNYRPKSWS